MGADDLRVGGRQRGVGQPELLRQIAAQVVDKSVGIGGEAMQHLPRLRLLEIERDAFLVAVEAVEELAVVAPLPIAEKERPDMAGHVAAIGRVLDLDHLGAEIGQLHRAIWPGAILLDRDDPQPGKDREHHLSSSAVIASEAKQSPRPFPLLRWGLLRRSAPRNDSAFCRAEERSVFRHSPIASRRLMAECAALFRPTELET